MSFKPAPLIHSGWKHVTIVIVSARDVTPEELKRLNGHTEAVHQKGSLPTRKFVDQVINVIEEAHEGSEQEGGE